MFGTSCLRKGGARHWEIRASFKIDKPMIYSDIREFGFSPKCQVPVASLAPVLCQPQIKKPGWRRFQPGSVNRTGVVT
jgi:hypothetical protein